MKVITINKFSTTSSFKYHHQKASLNTYRKYDLTFSKSNKFIIYV